MKKFITTILLAGVIGLAPAQSWASMIMKLYVVDGDKMSVIEKDAARRRALVSETKPARMLSIEKTWNGIDFLLTGTNKTDQGPRSWVIYGRRQIGEDMGYGPPGILTPDEVKQVAALLKEETPEKLASRYDPALMDKQKIYPEIWVSEGKNGLDWLLDYYRQLVSFYENAAKNGQGILIIIE